MNKYLISFVLLFVVVDAFAVVPIQQWGLQTVAQVVGYDYINLQEIKDTPADKYQFDNSVVYINSLSDWQNWDADIEFLTNVSLYIKNLSMSNNGTKLEHVSNSDVLNVAVKDADNLFAVNFTAAGSDLFFNLTRETDYTKIFRDSRGTFLEKLRRDHPNDKMLSAMDVSGSMREIHSVMNSSYHFNPVILINPLKTINHATLIDFLSEVNKGVGADVDYILSDKMDNYAGHIYIADKYKDLYFKASVNINRFSYSDNLNEFDGFVYGVDVRARRYLRDFWLDGLVGINRANFNADYIYINSGEGNDPKGMSEYIRLSIGYDCKQISDFVFSPFLGAMFQNTEVLGLSDKEANLHTGLGGRYSLVMDGIKYEYSAIVATDEKADFNVGANIGFLSVVDGVGAHVGIGAFKDDLGINYKLSINAKVRF